MHFFLMNTAHSLDKPYAELKKKKALMNFKIMTSIQSIFADYNRMKVEINNKKNKEIHYYVEIKQHTLKYQWVKEEITKKFLQLS